MIYFLEFYEILHYMYLLPFVLLVYTHEIWGIKRNVSYLASVVSFVLWEVYKLGH